MRRFCGIAALMAMATVLPAVAAPPADAHRIVSVGSALNAGSSQRIGRTNQSGARSNCDGGVGYSGTGLVPTTFRYDTFEFTNLLSEAACVTAVVDTACAGANAVMSSAYLGPFDPNNPNVGHVATMGNQTPTSNSYAFSVPAGATATIVVEETTGGAGCGGFQLDVYTERPWVFTLPQASGPPAVGSTLQVAGSSWVPLSATFTQRWERCDATGAACDFIPGAAGPTYVPTEADVGHTLRVRQTGSHNNLPATATSSPTVPVGLVVEERTGSLAAPDSVQQERLVRNGVRATCAGAKPVPAIQAASVAPRFYDNSTLTNPDDEAHCFTVSTRVGAAGCSSGVSPLTYGSPYSPGTSLTAGYIADAGAGVNTPLAPAATYAYMLPAGATAENVVVAASGPANCNQYSQTLISDAPFEKAPPELSGTAREGAALQASDGDWSPASSFTYRWLRCDAAGAACTPIAGATAASYSPGAADVGTRLRGQVTATAFGLSASTETGPSDVIAAAPAAGPPPLPPGGGGDPVPPLDRTAPRATFRLASSDLAKALRSGVPLTLTCDEACAVSGKLEVSKSLAKKLGLRSKTTLATVRGRGQAGRRVTLRARFPSSVRRRLRSVKTLNMSLKGTAADPLNNRSTFSAKVRLKRSRKS